MSGQKVMRAGAFAMCVTMLVLCCGCAGTENKAQDFNGAVIALKPGGYYALAAKEYTAQGALLENYSTVSDAVSAFEAGRADYIIANEYEAALYTASNPKLEIIDTCSYKTAFYGIFHNNGEKLRSFNSAIKQLTENGTVEEIKAAALSGSVFTKTALKGENGKLRVALDAVYAPLSAVNSNGEASGVNADIANEICAVTGMGLDIRVLSFDEAFEALLADEIDVILTATENSSARKSIVYSDCCFEMGYALLG